MYTAYFGLTENPFSITPDPRYLYLSERHREALAHLLYGACEGGGFVQLTGEVGTGKTTVCRAFLDQVPGQVDVALILNPALTAPELLQAICDELRVAVPENRDSTKELVDRLNGYLLDAHARGRRTVVIIDEAQNLKPAVLEQIRLLTNLETDTHKLLQIFLIGQPELRRVLDQRGLRQVAQRITARYHLGALSRAETADYIRHRLVVAGCARPLFSAGALRLIYRYTGGVPRLVNNLCDRALLGAYATGRYQARTGIVRRAARELWGEPSLACLQLPRYWWKFGPALAVALVAAGAGFAWWQPPARFDSVPTTVTGGAVMPTVTEQHGSDVQAIPAANAEPRSQLAQVLQDPAILMDQRTVENRLLSRWGIAASESPNLRLCDRAALHGLKCLEKTGAWDNLRDYNRPAIIRLRDDSGRIFFTVAAALEGDSVTLDFGGREISFPLTEVDRFWHGDFVLLWRPPVDGVDVIRPGMMGKEVQWLRLALDRVQGVTESVPVGDLAFFDAVLVKRVKAFQQSRGLAVDGIVGAETMIRLSAAADISTDPQAVRSGVQ